VLLALKRQYAPFHAPYLCAVHKVQRQKPKQECDNNQSWQFRIQAKTAPKADGHSVPIVDREHNQPDNDRYPNQRF